MGFAPITKHKGRPAGFHLTPERKLQISLTAKRIRAEQKAKKEAAKLKGVGI